jgi:hypothetical protein
MVNGISKSLQSLLHVSRYGHLNEYFIRMSNDPVTAAWSPPIVKIEVNVFMGFESALAF